MPCIPVPQPRLQSSTTPEDTVQVLMYQQDNTALQQRHTAVAQLSLQSTLSRQGKVVLQSSSILQDSTSLVVPCMAARPLRRLHTRSLTGMARQLQAQIQQGNTTQLLRHTEFAERYLQRSTCQTRT